MVVGLVGTLRSLPRPLSLSAARGSRLPFEEGPCIVAGLLLILVVAIDAAGWRGDPELEDDVVLDDELDPGDMFA